MEVDFALRDKRPVLVQTIHGAVEGWLVVDPKIRTSDYLNLSCHRFLTVGIAGPPATGWDFEAGNVCITTAAVLFVLEMKDRLPTSDRRVEATRFARAAVRLRLADHDVQGFMHVPALSDPMARLVTNRQSFLSLTSASVVGPDCERAASFLAVNPEHILAIQQIVAESADTADASANAWSPAVPA